MIISLKIMSRRNACGLILFCIEKQKRPWNQWFAFAIELPYYTAVESFTQLSEGRENTQKELRKQTLLKTVHCILGAFETSITFSEMDHGFLDDGAVIFVVFIVDETMKKCIETDLDISI